MNSKKRETIIWFFVFAIIISLYSLPLLFIASDDIRMVSIFSLDEGRTAGEILAMIKNKTLNPHFFIYGSIYFYLVLFCIFLGNHLPLSMFPFFNLSKTQQILEQNIIVGQRFISFVFAILSVYATYFLSKKIFGKKVAVLASLLFAATPSLLSLSVLGHPDTTQLFFVIVSIYFCSKLIENSSLRNLFGASVFAGLSFGTKYVGIFLLPAVWFSYLLALIIDISKQSSQLDRKLFLKKISSGTLFVPIVFLITFFVTNPYSFLDYKGFMGSFEYNRVTILEYPRNYGSVSNAFVWLNVLSSNKIIGSGVTFLFAGFLVHFLLGAFTFVCHGEEKIEYSQVIIIFFWIIIFLSFLSNSIYIHRYHYILPIVPFFFIFVSKAFYVYMSFANKINNRFGKLVKVLLIGLIFFSFWPRLGEAWNVFFTQFKRVESVDSQNVIKAGKWIKYHFPTDWKIAMDAYLYIPSEFKNVESSIGLSLEIIDRVKPHVIAANERRWREFSDMRRAKNHPFGEEDFKSRHLFYQLLTQGELKDYILVKEFDHVKILLRKDLDYSLVDWQS